MTQYGTKGLDVEGDEISLKESLKKKNSYLSIFPLTSIEPFHSPKFYNYSLRLFTETFFGETQMVPLYCCEKPLFILSAQLTSVGYIVASNPGIAATATKKTKDHDPHIHKRLIETYLYAGVPWCVCVKDSVSV